MITRYMALVGAILTFLSLSSAGLAEQAEPVEQAQEVGEVDLYDPSVYLDVPVPQQAEGVPEEARGARFVTTLVLTRRGKADMLAEGFVEGRILFVPRGNNGFGYDPLFYYEPLQRSFAELSAEEKNEVSHRRNALQTLCAQLKAEE